MIKCNKNSEHKGRICLLVDLLLIYCNFPERRKIILFFFLIYLPTLNIVLFLTGHVCFYRFSEKLSALYQFQFQYRIGQPISK